MKFNVRLAPPQPAFAPRPAATEPGPTIRAPKAPERLEDRNAVAALDTLARLRADAHRAQLKSLRYSGSSASAERHLERSALYDAAAAEWEAALRVWIGRKASA